MPQRRRSAAANVILSAEPMSVPSPAELRAELDELRGRVIVIDTTVLVYAVGDLHEFREPCRQLVAAVQRGDITATTTVEVIQEFAHVRARRRTRGDAVRLSGAYATMLSPLLVVEEADLRTGLGLFQQHPELGPLMRCLRRPRFRSRRRRSSPPIRGFAAVEHLRHVMPDKQGIQSVLT